MLSTSHPWVSGPSLTLNRSQRFFPRPLCNFTETFYPDSPMVTGPRVLSRRLPHTVPPAYVLVSRPWYPECTRCDSNERGKSFIRCLHWCGSPTKTHGAEGCDGVRSGNGFVRVCTGPRDGDSQGLPGSDRDGTQDCEGPGGLYRWRRTDPIGVSL